MVFGMATVKVTVTLSEEQLRRIRALVDEGRAANVSSFVQRAVDVTLDETRAWATMLSAALTETGGPLTDEERAWADSVLGASQGRRAPGSDTAA
jgi:Arc/MetJ-type ribon-helix-helix transcriptional regulator